MWKFNCLDPVGSELARKGLWRTDAPTIIDVNG